MIVEINLKKNNKNISYDNVDDCYVKNGILHIEKESVEICIPMNNIADYLIRNKSY